MLCLILYEAFLCNPSKAVKKMLFRQNSKLFSINPDRIAAAGGSAGGHLAAVTANIDLFDNKNEDLSVSSKPNLLILYNPVIDFGSRKWLWINNPSNASPIHNIKEGSPPTIILSGTDCLLYTSPSPRD